MYFRVNARYLKELQMTQIYAFIKINVRIYITYQNFLYSSN
jgi:predicted GNAT family N-acyltransferase